MDNPSQAELRKALDEKRLGQRAYEEILRWLSDPERAEFVPELSKRIAAGEWDFLEDAFSRTAVFGTGGIRAVMEMGTDRMNNYTVRWASQAYAQYLLKYKSEAAAKGIAVAYDSRLHSEEFMREAARVFAANGIVVHLFDGCRPTPELSFAIRRLALAGGVVITASHNPPQFNGYKAYNEYGCQLLPDEGVLMEKEFAVAAPAIKKMTFDDASAQGLVRMIDPDMDREFVASAARVAVSDLRKARIVYSPLHGTGSRSVLPALKVAGFEDIITVQEQMTFDGTFPAVKDHFPNPELPAVYEQALALAKEHSADIVLVSDPDADRLGMAVPDKEGTWHILTGNEAGALLVHFALARRTEAKTLAANAVVIKTSVTTDLVRDIGERFGVRVIGDLLVGFKFIGYRMEHLAETENFFAGCEESCGYLFTDAYRDKGAETPAVIAAEMAAWCRSHNTTPADLLSSIYKEYGYYAQRLYNRTVEGLGALDRMNRAMVVFRKEVPKEIGGLPVLKVLDRLTGEVRDGQTGAVIETRAWDKGDMLSMFFTDDERTALHIRPSGTEPKMKYYTAAKGDLGSKDRAAIDAEAEAIEKDAVALFEKVLADISSVA